MDPTTHNHLEKLLATFDVTDLGDGNPVAGANALAAMCCTLAAVARPGSGVVTPTERTLRIGTSILVSGAASSGRVVDEVLLEVGMRQNHYIQHLERDLQWKEQEKHNPLDCTIDGRPLEKIAKIPASELPERGSDFSLGAPVSEWSAMLTRPPLEGVKPPVSAAKFFVAVSKPKDLEKALAGLCRGHPLVHLAAHRASDLEQSAEAVGALMDGCQPIGLLGETLYGNVVITDPSSVLEEAARAAGEGAGELERFLWLCDSDAGPEPQINGVAENVDATDLISGRFREALGRALARRLGGDRMAPQIHEGDFTKAQYRWTRFLKEMEKSLPGISGAARNLPATLAFGLMEISRCSGRKKLSTTVNEVEAFARYLVLRMANARATILYSGKVSRRQSQIRRVFQKLGDVPMEARKVYQHLNLKADDCHECLKWLEASSFALRSELGWKRVEGAQLSFAGHSTLTLEV